jgi:hypothetical protein
MENSNNPEGRNSQKKEQNCNKNAKGCINVTPLSPPAVAVLPIETVLSTSNLHLLKPIAVQIILQGDHYQVGMIQLPFDLHE